MATGREPVAFLGNDMFTPEIQQALASPFEDSEIGWKPQVTGKGKNKEPIMRGDVQVAGCTAHIDARAVMNRLDEVVGSGNWSDCYTVLPNGKNVQCTLTVFGVSKADVGEPNDGGFADLMKGAYSDALKRAAVKFGIGRYLYDMEMEWLPYDGYKVTGTPSTGGKGMRPATTRPAVAGKATAQSAKVAEKAAGEFSPGASVIVSGNNSEADGEFVKYHSADGWPVVKVDGKELKVSPNRVKPGPPTQQAAFDSLSSASGAFSEDN